MNISISSLTNKSLDNSTISVRSLLNSQTTNNNQLINNSYKSTKINTKSKELIDNIISNNNETLKLKEQLYNKIYEICLQQINNNYKTKSYIIFEIPISYMDGNYSWIECMKYIIEQLKKYNYQINKVNNYLKISWENLKKKFLQ